MSKLYALVFIEDLPWDDRRNYENAPACWCRNWREVRRMIRYYYYSKNTVKVFRVKGQRPKQFAHPYRKESKGEIELFMKRWNETHPNQP